MNKKLVMSVFVMLLGFGQVINGNDLPTRRRADAATAKELSPKEKMQQKKEEAKKRVEARQQNFKNRQSILEDIRQKAQPRQAVCLKECSRNMVLFLKKHQSPEKKQKAVGSFLVIKRRTLKNS